MIRRIETVILLCFCLMLSTAAADGRRVVRVAFPEQDGMSMISQTGKITGCNDDSLEKISEYTGWQMEYVAYAAGNYNEAVTDAINDLREGNVDLLGPMLKSAAVEDMFEMPENSYGTVYTTLCTLTTSRLRENNIKSMKPLRVGLLEKTETRNNEVFSFLSGESIEYSAFYYQTAAQQRQALYDGEVDVISGLSLSPVANTRIVEQFAARPYSFAAAKGNAELIAEPDETIAKIDQAQPRLQETPYTHYFRSTDDVFALSAEQQKLPAQMKTLRVLCIDGDAPYVYQENGEPKGMLISILNDFASELNLKIEYTFAENRDAAEQLVARADYDLLAGLAFTSSYCAEQGFVACEPILQSPLAFGQNPLNGRRSSVAVARGLEELIDTSDYKDVIVCENEQACIKAVSDRRADVAVGDCSVLEYYIYETYSTLSTSLISGQTQNVSIAVSRKRDAALIEALNLYIYSLSNTSKTVYLSDGNMHAGVSAVMHYIRSHVVQTVLLGILLTALVAWMIFFIWNRARKHREQIQKTYTEELKNALEAAKAANQSKRAYISNISHDIRTPMNAIVGFTNLLEKDAEKPIKVREYTRKIADASNYLLSLINDVLDISKIESGKTSLSVREFKLGEMVSTVESLVRPQMDAKRQNFIVKTADIEHERVMGDETRVRQILMNLLSNAVKYTQPGGTIRLTVTGVKMSTAKKQGIRIVVQDTGCGMSRDFIDVLFDPFTRANSGSNCRVQGTGLGMAITKNIVDLMNGSIHVDSEVGVGSTFTVDLTFDVCEKIDFAFWKERGIDKILLGEADDGLRDTICAAMKSVGVQTDCVRKTEGMLRLLRQVKNYPVILLDENLLEGGDLSLIGKIRASISEKTILLVMICERETSFEAIRKAGADGTISRNFFLSLLQNRIREIEDRQEGKQTDSGLKGLNVLAAEDNELNAEILREVLDMFGAKCTLCENGQQAVERFAASRAGEYDLILMDIQMPVMDGYEATRAIRAGIHPDAKTIPIVAMTANAFSEDVQKSIDAGMNAHISKPVDAHSLNKMIGDLMQSLKR